jgi:dUTP pyrophosphatase
MLTLRETAVTLTPMSTTPVGVVKLHPGARLPARATPGASAYDLYACLGAPATLTRQPQLIPTGVALEIPQGLDVQVRPRSGLSARGVGVAFGTIDADYRGEVLVTMWTFGDVTDYEVCDGDRIAQLVIARLADVTLEEIAAVSNSERGAAGHGSTGR